MEEVNYQSQAQQQKNPTHAGFNLSWKSKIILICLGILFVIIPIGVYILGTKKTQPPVENIAQPSPTPSPTPDPTANWATFTVKKYEFEIRYPQGWQIDKNKDSETYYIFNIEIDKKNREAAGKIAADGSAFNNGIFLSIYESNAELESFIESYYNNPNSPHGKTIESTTNVIFPNGMPAIYVQSNTAGFGLDSSTLLKYKNNIFMFTKFYGGSAGIERYRDQQFNEILSTFKFTDQSQILDTSNWKTYVNTKAGFQIKYPQTLIISENITVSEKAEKVTLDFPKDPSRDFYFAGIGVEVNSIPQNTSIEQAIEKVYSQRYPIKDLKFQKVTIDGLVGLAASSPSAFYSYNAYVVRNEKLYELQLSANTGSAEPMLEKKIFDQIISAFRFVDLNTSFVCPKTEYLGCKPSGDTVADKRCIPEYLNWAINNCPNFKGATK